MGILSSLKIMSNLADILRIIGQEIKDLRRRQGLTQSALASMCDVDIRTIQRIERGEFNMSFRILFAIGNSLGIRLSEFMRDIENISLHHLSNPNQR
jgi:transcriptional regulator with XRE-family HTH domain